MFEESILLEGRCTAEPIPSFTWTLDGKAIAVGTKYRQGILSEGNTHTIFLEISQVNSKDSGAYKVTAKNVKGDGSANIQLNIEGVDFKFVEIIESKFYRVSFILLDYPKDLHLHFLINHQLNKMLKQLLFKLILLLIQVHHYIGLKMEKNYLMLIKSSHVLIEKETINTQFHLTLRFKHFNVSLYLLSKIFFV